MGITLFYLKPNIQILPAFVENLLPGRNWSVQYPESGDLSDFKEQAIQEFQENDHPEILFTDDYASEQGIFCFRGNAQRNAPSRGVLKQIPTKVKIDWEFQTAVDTRVSEHGSWGGGSGWTGQPLVINWPKEKAALLFGMKREFLSGTHQKEVVVGSLCGNIYFLDWKTGKSTRPHLSIDNPIKGTVSVDPRMNGLLYVGQGIKNGDRFGAYVFNMFSGKEVFFRSGLDPKAPRNWGAFDSNSLIDPKTGTWFHPAENGLIYKTLVKNSSQIHTQTVYKYHVSSRPAAGIESSMAAWNNLGWFGDNGGNVFCLDLMTMKALWCVNNFDDTDASMVLDLAENPKNPYLYIGNEVDLQGDEGTAFIRKIDGLTGKEVWNVSRKSTNKKVGGRVNSGGVLASVLPGKHQAKQLVYGVFSRIDGTMAGEFVAINKQTGKIHFSLKMDHYSWASPVDLYDKDGNCYLFFTDVYGTIYLINGVTGNIIHKEKTSFVWESSPIAWDNRIVVGSRGNKIVSFVVE